ncbi:hypothetical protein SKAU_G00119510 [Synaphobranchus kaupii]|uniref:Uncharacterized protein n=1 Tax=Synaphobranchus kaupii TaxID=118154 RepID=A0A9Q1FNV1_SYNKA|nr:hypothetical protein SKAU_G00119510 [Synaphobranchus kaupii]
MFRSPFALSVMQGGAWDIKFTYLGIPRMIWGLYPSKRDKHVMALKAYQILNSLFPLFNLTRSSCRWGFLQNPSWGKGSAAQSWRCRTAWTGRERPTAQRRVLHSETGNTSLTATPDCGLPYGSDPEDGDQTEATCTLPHEAQIAEKILDEDDELRNLSVTVTDARGGTGADAEEQRGRGEPHLGPPYASRAPAKPPRSSAPPPPIPL